MIYTTKYFGLCKLLIQYRSVFFTQTNIFFDSCSRKSQTYQGIWYTVTPKHKLGTTVYWLSLKNQNIQLWIHRKKYCRHDFCHIIRKTNVNKCKLELWIITPTIQTPIMPKLETKTNRNWFPLSSRNTWCFLKKRTVNVAAVTILQLFSDIIPNDVCIFVPSWYGMNPR